MYLQCNQALAREQTLRLINHRKMYSACMYLFNNSCSNITSQLGVFMVGYCSFKFRILQLQYKFNQLAKWNSLIGLARKCPKILALRNKPLLHSMKGRWFISKSVQVVNLALVHHLCTTCEIHKSRKLACARTFPR